VCGLLAHNIYSLVQIVTKKKKQRHQIFIGFIIDKSVNLNTIIFAPNLKIVKPGTIICPVQPFFF